MSFDDPLRQPVASLDPLIRPRHPGEPRPPEPRPKPLDLLIEWPQMLHPHPIDAADLLQAEVGIREGLHPPRAEPQAPGQPPDDRGVLRDVVRPDPEVLPVLREHLAGCRVQDYPRRGGGPGVALGGPVGVEMENGVIRCDIISSHWGC